MISVKRLQGLTPFQAMDWIVTQTNDLRLKQHWQQSSDGLKGFSSYLPMALDAKVLTVLAVEMQRSGNMFSTYQVKTYSGKAYIIFKGYPALRSHLTGTRYLANNPKIIQLGVGKLGAMNAVKSGFILSIIVSAAFHSLDQLIDDQKTWHHFFAGFTLDITIAFGSTAIAAGIVSWTIGTAAMVTIGPLVAVVAIGAFITYGTNTLINTNQITDEVAAFLKQAEDNFKDKIHDTRYQINKIQRQQNEDPLGFMHRLFAIPTFQGMK
ncbi:hypothetical protein [Thalassomonas haliotis]|uniref:Uncharacterized protein n=1 Tax=Thalassomonas haliotis TaxID=485448 RepID=A0ABY7V9M2_9GAMM|nr:hypothetical protein [Thalassomonas haliotis]WDE09744.1 hypothetical protein H3N35_15610 [Thalassomonas haliotis]